MKVGPRPRLSRSAALATDAKAAEHPGGTVAAGIAISRAAREAGHNRRER